MVDTITFGKPFHHVIPVLPYPFDEILSDTDIESAISLARQNVYGGLLIHRFLLFPLDSGFRRNDERRNDSISKRGTKWDFSSVLMVLFETNPGFSNQLLKINARFIPMLFKESPLESAI
jgi:hypothetical protein